MADPSGRPYCDSTDVGRWAVDLQFWWVCFGARWLSFGDSRWVGFRYLVGVNLKEDEWWKEQLGRLFGTVLALGDGRGSGASLKVTTTAIYRAAEDGYVAGKLSRETLLLAQSYDEGIEWS